MIDLIVVEYKTPDLLQRLVDTLHSDYEPGVWRLHIVSNLDPNDEDNATASVQKLIDLQVHPDYHIHTTIAQENMGYSASINKVASRTHSEFLCAVNADTWFTTNHVKEVEESFRKHDNAAIIGVKQMDEQNYIRHGGIIWDGKSNPIHRGWNHYDPQDILFKDVIPCWTVSGSIYYVRRVVWDQMASYEPFRKLYPNDQGAFLPTPHYFEETFCSQLAHHLGYDVIYDGSVETAGHSWHASNPVGSNVNLFDISRNIYIKACEAIGIPHECH